MPSERPRGAGLPPLGILIAAGVSTLIATALALRQEYTVDEANRWVLSQLPPQQMLHLNVSITAGNELYLMLLHILGPLRPSPRFWRLLSIAPHLGAILWAYRLFSRSAGERIGRYVALWLAFSPLHLFEAQELKEYSLAVLISLPIAFASCAGPLPSMRRALMLGLVQAAGTMLTLALSPFWCALAAAQLVLGRADFRRALRTVTVQHSPMAIVSLATLLRWDPAYRPLYVELNSVATQVNLFEVLGDFFSFVYVWGGMPLHEYPAPCIAPPPAWFYPTLNGMAILVGGGVLILSLRAFSKGCVGVHRRLALWFAVLGLFPMAAYFIGTSVIGHGHLYMSRLYIPSSPFVYGLVGAGLSTVRRPLRWLAMTPVWVLTGFMLILILQGKHGAQPEGLRATLGDLDRQVQPGEKVYVHPGIGYDYVRLNASDDLSTHLKPLGKDMFTDRRGDGSFVVPISDPELADWGHELEKQSGTWVITLPEFLIIKDPGLKILAVADRAWDLLACNRSIAVYRSR